LKEISNNLLALSLLYKVFVDEQKIILFKTNPTFMRNREAYEDGFLELDKLFKY
jgi:hypothetical protein